MTDIPAILRCKQIANVGKSYILHNQNTVIYRDKKNWKALSKENVPDICKILVIKLYYKQLEIEPFMQVTLSAKRMDILKRKIQSPTPKNQMNNKWKKQQLKDCT